MKTRKNRVIRDEQTINHETGEITSRTTVFQFDREPNYIKLYFDCLGVVLGNDGLNTCFNDMLVEVLALGSYANDGQHVVLNAYNKKIVCERTGKSIRRLEQAIKTWSDNGVLKRVARGTYQINPWIFGKGEWRDISTLRATFDFTNSQLTTERGYEWKEARDAGRDGEDSCS